MTSRDEVQERIRRAQLAILNPTTESLSFLTGDENTQNRSRSFSQNCVIVELSGNQLSDLNFVDLPGLIANVSDDRNIGDIQLVQNLVTAYISRPSCLILLTITCESDYENQGAGRLARKHDPNGRRTIGVLTKPDRIEPESEGPWISMIKGESNPLRHGWFSVKQPSARQLDAGLSWEGARLLDRKFFEDTPPWSTIDTQYRHRLGCANLIAHLGDTLGKLILTRLPHICNEVDRLIHLNAKSLAALPARTSLDPLAEVLQLINGFTREVSRHVSGDSRSGRAGLVQALVTSAKAFQDQLRGITPVFRPVKKGNSQTGWTSTPSFLPKGETWPARSELGRNYWLDDIIELAEGARTRELPGEFPFAVKEELIIRTIESWRVPAEEAFVRAQDIFLQRLTALVEKHFGKHAYGGLRGAVMKIVVEKLEELQAATEQELKFLLKMESLPFTLNSHYYLDYREKFMAHYKYYQGEQNRHIRLLREPDLSTITRPVTGPRTWNEPTEERIDHVEEALKSLRLAGLQGLKREDMIKLLPADFSTEAALEIMASVRAYYQVAYKRFADNIPLAIDQRYINAFDETVSVALFTGLAIGDEGARDKCAAWLAESQAVVRQRAELQDRKSRLAEARRELLEVPGVSAMRDKIMNAAKKRPPRRSDHHRDTTNGTNATTGVAETRSVEESPTLFIAEEPVVETERCAPAPVQEVPYEISEAPKIYPMRANAPVFSPSAPFVFGKSR
ncbi:dynamin central region protein [Ceratobasidium sp. AG-Ba]|nr:dynamin central region protein [Ceratobasidium sp. AG-Ba]